MVRQQCAQCGRRPTQPARGRRACDRHPWLWLIAGLFVVSACKPQTTTLRAEPATDAGPEVDQTMKPTTIPTTPDDGDATALEVLLKAECQPEEVLAVFPQDARIRGLTDWRRFSVVCTHTETQVRRILHVVARKKPAEVGHVVFSNRPIPREHLRGVRDTYEYPTHGLAFLIDFAYEEVDGVFHDHNGPGGEVLAWSTRGPGLDGDTFTFFASNGMTFVTVDLSGDGNASPLVEFAADKAPSK